jgi:hypothetical protein
MSPTSREAEVPAATMVCLSCHVPMVPAQVRNIRVYIQPGGSFWSTKGVETEIFVCPQCGRIDSRVADLTLFRA